MSASKLSPRILVVDDEPDIAASFCELLRTLLPGVQVDKALSGREAVEFLRHAPVDLVVTDFKMPGMNGVELLRKLEELAPGTPNILVTAFGLDTVQAAGGPEPDRILHKPIKIDEFVGAVEEALASA